MNTPAVIDSYCSAVVPAGARFSALFSSYPLKIYHGNDGEYSLLGRGSAGVIPSIHAFGGENTGKPLVEIGNFCQMASDCALLAGGEHRNELVFNNSLRGFPYYEQTLRQKGQDYFRNYSKGPITLGANVTISHGVTVLSGVTIGDGAVIGAGSVVTQDIPPFAIAAGNPAKVIKYRFPENDIKKLLELRWWDFEIGLLMEHLELFNNQSVDEVVATAHKKVIPYAKPSGRLCFTSSRKSVAGGKQTHFQFKGVEISERFIAPEKLPKEFRDYIDQTNAPADQPLHLSHTLFERFKL